MRPKKKVQSVIIASRGKNTSMICDGRFYSGIGMTEIDFHHKAGENSEIRITCDQLPMDPDENADSKDGFKKWLEYLMEEESPSREEGAGAHYKTE